MNRLEQAVAELSAEGRCGRALTPSVLVTSTLGSPVLR